MLPAALWPESRGGAVYDRDRQSFSNGAACHFWDTVAAGSDDELIALLPLEQQRVNVGHVVLLLLCTACTALPVSAARVEVTTCSTYVGQSAEQLAPLRAVLTLQPPPVGRLLRRILNINLIPLSLCLVCMIGATRRGAPADLLGVLSLVALFLSSLFSRSDSLLLPSWARGRPCLFGGRGVFPSLCPTQRRSPLPRPAWGLRPWWYGL